MNDRLHVTQAVARVALQATAADSDIERVRRHVAKIRLQIKELEQRTRRTAPTVISIRIR